MSSFASGGGDDQCRDSKQQRRGGQFRYAVHGDQAELLTLAEDALNKNEGVRVVLIGAINSQRA